VKIELEDAAAPLARLLGHSVAAAVGFCALAAISIIPLEVLRLLSQIGISELVQPLRGSLSKRCCLPMFACSR
jgi:hypothetical protein